MAHAAKKSKLVRVEGSYSTTSTHWYELWGQLLRPHFVVDILIPPPNPSRASIVPPMEPANIEELR